jgi:hypothetical protein
MEQRVDSADSFHHIRKEEINRRKLYLLISFDFWDDRKQRFDRGGDVATAVMS